MLFDHSSIDHLKEELVTCIHFLHSQHWAPATSSNYSFRIPDHDMYCISQSGKDKGEFDYNDLMIINNSGEPVEDVELRPSAETLLHTLIYENPLTNCVLHTHSAINTVLSTAHLAEGKVTIAGYELLKGLSGIATHNHSVDIPIFDNDQDMTSLSQKIRMYQASNPNMYGFLLAGHGLYTWGKTIKEARRHIEVLEFLFEVTFKSKLYGRS
ncbi:MAG: methylthioribulose 1-phosphate dehydratase [Bacteroidota bacterium]|nr:methylthioribulose 1-phosphate dehydratase [Bacteroidota bacterium]